MQVPLDNDSSDSESWNSKMNSSVSESLAEPLGPLEEIVNISNLKPGDYILVEFESNNKRRIKYKYVATVEQIMSSNEVEIQCFESVDEENTEFVIIDNDISVIDFSNILGKLPFPNLRKRGRQLLSVFPGVVDIFQQF